MTWNATLRATGRQHAAILGIAATALVLLAGGTAPLSAGPGAWKAEWPSTDFSKAGVSLDEIVSGGPPKDGIPAIDDPRFVPLADYAPKSPTEPVIALSVGGEARAYPLRVLIWHEIVNDTVAGTPVAVTYCPLCNSAVVFERQVKGRILDFGTTGKLRKSDLVMYDRQTESWWQQFNGNAIIGEMTGTKLEMLPSRVESISLFRERHPEGRVLVPTDPSMRPYGTNPYVGYDSSRVPFLYGGPLPEGIEPLSYVVRVGDQAWTLDRLRREKRIEEGDLVLSWSPGRNSALDSSDIASGRDIGNVVVQRRTAAGLVDEVHDVTFAFVFHAFVGDGTLHR